METLQTSLQTVIITFDGSPTPIIGKGFVALSESLTLDSILCSSISHNLLFVSQIIMILDCIVMFWPSFYIFQDILTRRILGYGVKKRKLYYLDLTDSGSQKLVYAHHTSGVKSANATVWLWHHRLSYLSFGYLKNLRPHLFSNISELDLYCDVYELAKIQLSSLFS